VRERARARAKLTVLAYLVLPDMGSGRCEEMATLRKKTITCIFTGSRLPLSPLRVLISLSLVYCFVKKKWLTTLHVHLKVID
jgi:hypothetical protein